MKATDVIVRRAVEVSFAMRKRAAGRVPWDFSEDPIPGQDTLNLPTNAGRALGAQIARLADIAEADQLKQFPNMKRRCSDCAARAGTLPNGCEETLMDFIKCVVEGRQFNCHLGVKEGETPTRVCAGWMVLYLARHAR